MLFSEMDIPLDGNLNWYSGFFNLEGEMERGGGMENGKGGDGKWLWVICMLWPAFLGNETCFYYPSVGAQEQRRKKQIFTYVLFT
jgi:hypothetical protein